MDDRSVWTVASRDIAADEELNKQYYVYIYVYIYMYVFLFVHI